MWICRHRRNAHHYDQVGIYGHSAVEMAIVFDRDFANGGAVGRRQEYQYHGSLPLLLWRRGTATAGYYLVLALGDPWWSAPVDWPPSNQDCARELQTRQGPRRPPPDPRCAECNEPAMVAIGTALSRPHCIAHYRAHFGFQPHG